MFGPASDINLQLTLAAANPPADMTAGHHPISCSTMLVLEEDGRMGCEHLYVPAGDPRTQGCVDHSIAILLLELLRQREETPT